MKNINKFITQSKFVSYIPIILFIAPLLIAYFSEYILGQEPCKLCIWQRYPLIIGLIPSFLYFYKPQKFLLFIILILFITDAGIAIYHSGVEEHLWESNCSTKDLDALTDIEKMRDMIHDKQADCGKPFYLIKGISMAKLNVLYNLLCSIIIFYIIKRKYY